MKRFEVNNCVMKHGKGKKVHLTTVMSNGARSKNNLKIEFRSLKFI